MSQVDFGDSSLGDTSFGISNSNAPLAGPGEFSGSNSAAAKPETTPAAPAKKKSRGIDVYTMMLILSLLALLVGIGLLYAELKNNGGEYAPGKRVPFVF